MAASSTLAMPSITSPSAGIMSPASQTTRSPFCKIGRGHFFLAAILQAARHRVLARLAQAVGLRFAAAFGHGFGEVGEQHREPEPDRELRDETAQSGVAVKMPTVVRAAPTMVTNMTGFLTIRRGSSFLNASPMAGPTMFQSKSERSFVLSSSMSMLKKVFPCASGSARRSGRAPAPAESSTRRPAARCRAAARRTCRRDRERAGAGRRDLLLHQRSGQRHDRHNHQEAANQHREPRVVLYQGVLAVRPAKALPLLPVPELKA